MINDDYETYREQAMILSCTVFGGDYAKLCLTALYIARGNINMATAYIYDMIDFQRMTR